ncbi:hypothetical protein J4E86_003818 [Alternaria arbusti]|uniref:uncharacterized protein n=1 Tax=Alternaria arbusti TaxID=232088 RepID=UPI00221EEC64|nr:uncharacterized protein J4E86_003818 [Alternaria arbusti]KAI4958220.1 hypothetical protein J4E86_003818 [Alternaria arbusti]
MPPRLQNKIAVITGSSSGIGRATALAFASEGASLICSDITETPRSEYATDTSPSTTTVAAAHALGAKALFVKCDTTSSTDIQALIQTAVQEYGRIDIMVNNAGISMETGEHGSRPVWEYEEAAFERTVDVNIKGVFLGTNVYGLRGTSGTSGYAASKHAVMGLTKSAALDCAPYRIHVNALCPGYTATAFISSLLTPEAADSKKEVETRHPFGGLGTPQDIARAAVFLASEDAAWVTGIGLPVDGGFSCM